MLARTVVPVCMSRTKMSDLELLSFETRFEASLSNATNLPSSETVGQEL